MIPLFLLFFNIVVDFLCSLYPLVMNKFRLLFFFTVLCCGLYSAPIKNVLTIVSQADGSKLTFYASGDEFFNRLHDSDDFTVILNDDGFYYFALLDDSGNLVSSKYRYGSVDPVKVGIPKGLVISHDQYLRKVEFFHSDQVFADLRKIESTPKYEKFALKTTIPNANIFNNIVIPISFPDAQDMLKSRSEYDSIYNAVSKPSLKSYYKEVSYGELDMRSSFFPNENSAILSYLADNSRKYYQAYNQTLNPLGYMNDEQRTGREHNLIANAINSLKSSIESNFSRDEIDLDQDGFVDNICFIVQGKSDGWSDLLWAHRWSLYSQDVFIHDKKVSTYVFQPENQVVVTTLCHEMFHALGAPDLYHYNEASSSLDPVGKWDLMHSGSGHMGAYMKYRYGGWFDQIPEITSIGSYSLRAIDSKTNDNVCYKVRSSKEREYFVLEFRKKGGLFEDQNYGSGLVVYRINENIAPDGNRNGPPDEVYVYRPYGSLSENGNILQSFFSSESRRTSFGGTLLVQSFLSDGTDGLLRIRNISSAGGESITFDITNIPVINTSVKNDWLDGVSFVVVDKALLIKDLKPYSRLQLFDVKGTCLFDQVISDSSTKFDGLMSGLYILMVDGCVKKIAIY